MKNWHPERSHTLAPRLLLAAALVLPASSRLEAEASSKQQVKALQGGAVEIKLDGDSTLHRFHSRSALADIQGNLKAAKGQGVLDAIKGGGLGPLSLAIPVESLKSGEDGLDKNMYKAMDSVDHPQVLFTMKSYSLKDSQVLALGSLEINGVTQAVSLTGALSELSGTARVKGSYDLLMSDYKVKAPVLMLGTIRCKDKVTIGYDFELKPVPEAASSKP
jgi:polyisoprenoid-binding protein YceI